MSNLRSRLAELNKKADDKENPDYFNPDDYNIEETLSHVMNQLEEILSILNTKNITDLDNEFNILLNRIHEKWEENEDK